VTLNWPADEAVGDQEKCEQEVDYNVQVRFKVCKCISNGSEGRGEERIRNIETGNFSGFIE